MTVIYKLAIKEMWSQSTNWDETPPSRTTEQWHGFINVLPQLNRIHVKRALGIIRGATTMLIGFLGSFNRARLIFDHRIY